MASRLQEEEMRTVARISILNGLSRVVLGPYWRVVRKAQRRKF
jgi:hypothetical protein